MSGGDPRAPDLPLMRWGEELRRRKASRRILRIRTGCTGIFVGLVMASTGWSPVPRLVWNASESAPIGLYRVAPGRRPQRGEMVVARLGPATARFAAERGYLPLGVPVVKTVTGVPGDRICADRVSVTVNGTSIAGRLAADIYGRSLPLWHGCRTLDGDHYLLLNRHVTRSFDGRYFGPTSGADILGVARLLWRR